MFRVEYCLNGEFGKSLSANEFIFPVTFLLFIFILISMKLHRENIVKQQMKMLTILLFVFL